MSDFCRVPEQALAEAATNMCRWPDGNVPWTLQSLLPGMSEEKMVGLLQPYFSKWKRVKVWYVHRAVEARVLVGARFIDGVNGVLADCYLPCGAVKNVKLQFDLGDNWDDRKFGQVGWHEFGHAIGISHSPNRGNIMYANLDMGVSALGAWDLAEEKKRYPIEVPPPLPSTKVYVDFKGTATGVIAKLVNANRAELAIDGQDIAAVTLAGSNVPPPTIPSGGGGMLDWLKNLGPLLDLLRNPEFQKLLALIVDIFTKKQALVADGEVAKLTAADYDDLAQQIKDAKP